MSLQRPKVAIRPNTSSIAWPDLIMKESDPRTIPTPGGALALDNQFQDCSTSLALLARLETSLQNSHKALMARDAVSLEELTREQASICQEISQRRRDLRLGDDRESPDSVPIQATSSPFANLRHPAAERVLHLGRVQCVLLNRMQQRSRILINLAGAGRFDRVTSCSDQGDANRHRWF